MKQILLGLGIASVAISAQAADLPVKAPYLKAPIAMVYDWTGFYAGANAGVGLGRDLTNLSIPLVPTTTFPSEQSYLSPQGAVGGGQIGYNKQFNNGIFGANWVLGAEADIQGTGMRDIYTCLLSCIDPGSYSKFNQKLDWFGTVRGRVGIASGPVLTYVTGGYAYGSVSTTLAEVIAPTTLTYSSNQTRSGYVLGSGLEVSLGGNWTGKLEYLYLNLGSAADTFNFDFFNRNNRLRVVPETLTTSVRENIFRVGVNYRIGDNKVAYVSPPARNWAGFYLGGTIGSGSARDRSVATVSQTVSIPEKFNLSPDGIVGGIHAGYNWQAANWVYGIEADIQASNQRDNRTCVQNCDGDLPSYLNYDARLPWFGTLRGRIGYSLGSTLFYGTAGLAYGGVQTKVAGVAFGPIPVSAEISQTRVGWTVGGGIETPFSFLGLFGPNWTSKIEYLYVDLGTSSGSALFPAPPNIGGDLTLTNSTHVTEHIFRSGLSYHFNSPVVAKY